MKFTVSGENLPTLPLLVIKLGEAQTPVRERFGDFSDWIIAGLRNGGANHITVVDPREGEALPDPSEVSGIVITGSRSMVTDRDSWSVKLMPWLVSAVEADTPMLGICFGHQILAQALGGETDSHPDGVEIGSISVDRFAAAEHDELLGHLPAQFDAQSVHWQSVRRLPPGAVLLAGNAFEAHHAYRVGRSAWGVQFHPEFSSEVMHAYLDQLSQSLANEGKDASSIKAGLRPTPQAASLLPTFAKIAISRQQTPVCCSDRSEYSEISEPQEADAIG